MIKIFYKLFFIFLFILSTNTNVNSEEDKIKIGVLVPLSGENKEIGDLILKATKLALKDIKTNKIEIYPKDTASNSNQALTSASEFLDLGVNIVIGPVFYESLSNLDKLENITFLSLTNKTINLPKNVISSGINATSQISAIKKFIELNELKKTIFLIPKINYEIEVKKAINQSKIKTSKIHIYDIEPTKLTQQIEKITNYKIRKQNLADEIRRVENSDLVDKEKQLEKLNKKYTIGRVKFDSVIISDFDESLKSVITSLLYTDVSPKKKYFITFNQWFDESLINETSLQPLYYPSINKKNLNDFKKKFNKEFNEAPNHLALLSYDLVGLVYYLSLQNEVSEINKIFKKKNSFKGKIGIFDVHNNKIYHRLNFYEVSDNQLKKIF